MNRRKFIVGSGSAAAATIGGVALLGGSASASVSGDPGTVTAEGTSDDGSVNDVIATADNVTFGYDGLDGEAEFAVVALSAGKDVGSGNQGILQAEVFEEDVDGLEKHGIDAGSFNGSVIENEHTDFSASDFKEDADGGDKTTLVNLQLTVAVFYDTPEDVTPERIGAGAGDNLGIQISTIEENLKTENYVIGRDRKKLAVTVNNEPKKAGAAADYGGDVHADN